MGSGRARVPEALAGERPLPTFDVPYFKYIDEEDEEDEWSSRSQSSTEDDSGDSLLSDRYVVVAGTPEKILEHLLSDLHLEAAQDKDTGKERAPTGPPALGSSPGMGTGGNGRGAAPGTPGWKPAAAFWYPACKPEKQREGNESLRSPGGAAQQQAACA